MGLELVFLHVHRHRQGQLLAPHRLPQQGKLCVSHRLAGGVGVVVDAHVQTGSFGIAIVGLKGGVDIQAVCPLGELAVGAHGLEHCPPCSPPCHLRPVDEAPDSGSRPQSGREARPASRSQPLPRGFGRFRCGLYLFGILLVPPGQRWPAPAFPAAPAAYPS